MYQLSIKSETKEFNCQNTEANYYFQEIVKRATNDFKPSVVIDLLKYLFKLSWSEGLNKKWGYFK